MASKRRTWRIWGVPEEIRALAEEAAAESGEPVGAWLGRMIDAQVAAEARAGPDRRRVVPPSAPMPADDVLRRLLPKTHKWLRLPVGRLHPSHLYGIGTGTTAMKGGVGVLVARPAPRVADAYEIVAGQAAWREAIMDGRSTLDAVVVEDLDDEAALVFVVADRAAASGTSPVVRAESCRWLLRHSDFAEDDVSALTGRSVEDIRDDLDLLNLPDPVQRLIDEGQLGADRGRALLKARTPTALARIAVAHDLDVADTARLVEIANDLADASPGGETVAAEQALADLLGGRVALRRAPDGSVRGIEAPDGNGDGRN